MTEYEIEHDDLENTSIWHGEYVHCYEEVKDDIKRDKSKDGN